MNPKISVVMSVYNAEKYLREAIESILNQTFKDFEFIIVNDYSTDNSLEILQSYKDKRIILINNEINLGLSKSCNKAISISRSNFIARMDSDDFSKPNRLELQYNFLNECPKIVALGTNADFIDMEGNYIYSSKLPNRNEEILRSLQNKSTLIHPTVMFRKDAFNLVGGYYEPIKHYFEDFILWTQLSKFGELHILEESLLRYRVVMNSISTKVVSEEYKKIEKTVAKRGYATDSELDFIIKEKNMVNKPLNSELSYYLILAQKLVFDSYNTTFARHYLWKAFLKSKVELNIYLLLILSFFPKSLLDKIYNYFSKQK